MLSSTCYFRKLSNPTKICGVVTPTSLIITYNNQADSWDVIWLENENGDKSCILQFERCIVADRY